MASALSALLSSHGFATVQVTEKDLAFGRDPKPTAILLSAVGAGMPALNALVSAQKVVPPIPVVVLVGPDQARIAVEALKLGATDAVVMPVENADLLSIVQSVRQKDEESASGRSKRAYPQRPAEDAAVLISRSPKMLQMWDVATTVARTDVPVLILGESGVGKEVLARFIQRHSRRADKPLVRVNCAALPHDLLESELFGYERGAFTGAVGEKPGRFELADKGTIVLDEIGEMPPSTQAKLLHVLEDGEFSRLGGKRPVNVDVRVLALTNRKLHEAIPRGEFRDDLYFRLSVVKINIPPLRERKEDIPLLAEYFLKRHRDALASSIKELPPELIDGFIQYHWPGNVRQLENTIRRYLILPELDMELNTIPAIPVSTPDSSKRAIAAATVARGAPISSPVIQLPGPNDSVSLKKVASMAAERAEREIVLHVFQQSRHGVDECVMLGFKPNDAVFILPRYAHLYADQSAVVTGVTADPFRPMFNEYALEFADRSSAKLFEFQIIEDGLNYTTFIASLVFDSREHPVTTATRGLPSGRQIILQTPGFDLDMRIHTTKSRATIMGQVLERGTKSLLKDLEVRLIKESMPITTVISDSLGAFKFSDIPHGSLNILVVIPQYSSRILGAFSV